MTDWFVYQHDLYVNDLDPNSLGLSLQPKYDACKNIMYRDSSNTNGLRRVQSYWGIDPLITQFDIVIQLQLHPSNGIPLQNSSHATQCISWIPAHQELNFVNTVLGFNFENKTTHQCVVVTRDPKNLTSATILQKERHRHHTNNVGEVIMIRMHRLAQLTPSSLNTTTFSKYVTAHLNVGDFGGN